MRKTLIDINPWGVIKDMHAEEALDAAYFAALYKQGNRDIKYLGEDGDILKLAHLNDVIRLKIRKVLGGNQWNVFENLRAMRAKDVDIHLGMNKGEVARKVLYVPGIKGKIDLVNPTEVGDLVWNRDLADTDVFVSSSPPRVGGETYWAGLRDALARDTSTGIYWNPQTRQIAKDGLAPKTLQALKGRVKILQVNEPEAHEMVRNYLHADGDIDRLPDLVGSRWTVITKAAQGITAFENGVRHDEPISQFDDFVRKILGEDYYPEGMEVGCGDMFLSTLIMSQDLPIKTALKHAALMAKMQYHHTGSNISTVKNFQEFQAAVQ